jgi:hypothetical protein
LKFSANLKGSEPSDFRSINENSFRLDFSEREIDLAWKKIENERYICAISMIEKIVITDDKMRILYSYKINLLENTNIISSLFWLGKTLIYSKGSSINYFYGEDGIHQKIFTCDTDNTVISGLLSDRFLLVSKVMGIKESKDVIVSSPMINSLEPILIGYLDDPQLDYNLVKEAVTNLFTNQFSQNLIDKFLKKDLKEISWVFLSDSKSSYQNLDIKIQVMNDLLKFESSLDYILPNKNLKNEMDLDEIIWKLAYDHSIEYIRNILIGECNILINYGQFDTALKILELVGDYPKAINLLFISSSKEEYEKLRVLFMAKACLSFTDNMLLNSIFRPNSGLGSYNKIFDNYKGEPFIFGANIDKFKVLSIQEALNKLTKKNSHISNFSKKILSYGEIPFTQYTKLMNKETSKWELMNICSLVLQKVDQYYGYKNTIYEKDSTNQKKVDFTDYSVPLSNLKSTEEIHEDSIDQAVDEISEVQYLTAYFHCDKGSGLLLEDITENNTEAILSMVIPTEEILSEENLLWTNFLEEFDPLEYEDKWGRKSSPSHAIKFNSMKYF